MTLGKSILGYGVAMAALMAILKVVEYRFFVRDLSLEIYIGIVAVVFIVLGAWIGRRLTRVRVVTAAIDFELNQDNLKKLGITKREHEVLELIAAGMSNQEIADKLFVSPSTIKTHTSNLYSKLDASRRTQAAQRAKELGIIA
ncbi:MAG: LuxR C-terminal-related transcriptional regulator [Pyrinomonadaceae bacterium]